MKRKPKKAGTLLVRPAGEFVTLASVRAGLSPGDEVAFQAPDHTMVYIGELQGGPVFKTAGGSWVWPALDARCRVVRSPNAERLAAMAVTDEVADVDPVRGPLRQEPGTLDLDSPSEHRYR